MKKKRVGVVGAGNMGKHHARIYKQIANLVAIADISEKTGLTLAKRYKAKYYKNYTEMLDKENLDAVSVVVPTHLHKTIALECLKRNIATLVEKPIASSIEDAKKIVASAKKNKTFLMVGHIERFNPSVNILKEKVREGKIGKIISLLAIRVGVSFPKIGNPDVALDLGIHDVDIFNYLLEDVPIKTKIIRTKLFTQNASDSAAIVLEYKNATGIIQTNWITPIKMRKLYVSGTNGYAELDYINQRLILYDKVMKVKSNGNYFDLVAFSKHPKKKIHISKKEPLREELIAFLEKKKTFVSGEDAMKALKIYI